MTGEKKKPYGENKPTFCFLRRQKGGAPKNGGAASSTWTPAHGALSGIIAKKVRPQRTAARLTGKY